MKQSRSEASRKTQMVLGFDERPADLLGADEIFEIADEKLLSSLTEDRRIERKSSRFGGDKLGEYICMWANTPPDGGMIVIGQSDSGGFEGLSSLPAEKINILEKAGHTHCPDARYETKRVGVTNKEGNHDFVLVFRVRYEKGIVVKTSKQRAFRRVGDSCVSLGDCEVRELQADKGQVSFELSDSGLLWPSEFCVDSAKRFTESVRSVRGWSDEHTTEEILELRRLGESRQGVFFPNVGCALLFARDPQKVVPGCKIRFQRFEGEVEGTGTKWNAVKDVILEGTVPSLISELEGLLESQLRTFSPLDSKMKFYPVEEYPKAAWYEAVVNACVHRSYGNGLKNMPTFVKMFDDRLVIESPGPFPPLVTPMNIYEMHNPRNPNLMDAMFYLDYVRCAHEGTRRIRDTMAELRLPPPEFAQASSGPPVVSVVLRNNVKQRRAWVDRDVSKIISEAIAADFTDNERQALNLAAANGAITISDANKLLGISWQAAKKILLGLARKRVFQYIRFKSYEKDTRDPRAYFRLRSSDPLPEGGFEPDLNEQ